MSVATSSRRGAAEPTAGMAAGRQRVAAAAMAANGHEMRAGGRAGRWLGMDGMGWAGLGSVAGRGKTMLHTLHGCAR